MSLIAVGYPVIPRRDFEWIQSLRKKYDRDGYNLIKAHFTLVFPVDNIAQPRFLDHIRPRINNFAKIQFELCRFNLCNKPYEGKWFIFLVPERGREEIIELHDILYSDLLVPELSTEYPFDPHITIGRLEDKNECLEIIGNLNKADFRIMGWIETIDAAVYDNDIIETIDRINLK